MGRVAGLVGGLAAAVAAQLLAHRLFDVTVDRQPLPAVLACTTTSLLSLSLLTGAAASRGLLARPPLEILRDEG